MINTDDAVQIVKQAIDYIRQPGADLTENSIAQRTGIAIGLAKGFFHAGLIDHDVNWKLRRDAEFMGKHALEMVSSVKS